eukprot:Plantae.Rhodophyta-Hildenbrandia_rubra.ctg13842.p1 GENE.Plantae.Rhodophyta-Hildenbrandia_rubra.ctg13842~~Plantae.Rhodophyta-Hildenbrandia_rubra.ctg13842.p1  ORF type:complete len:583 (+),score=108.75 Plantae.Rhodophyta-Hildenbrandia_rubra.ctg13842:65-1813(+)
MKRLGCGIFSCSRTLSFQSPLLLSQKQPANTFSRQFRRQIRHSTKNPLHTRPICSVVPNIDLQKNKKQQQKNVTLDTKKSGRESGRGITPRSEDYSQWYLDVISAAELAETAPVRGCVVIRPHGYRIWEIMKEGLDKRIKEQGAQNAYFPLLIPQSFLEKEAEHVEGFAKECAVVTHHRLKENDGRSEGGRMLIPDPEAELEEALVIRPTSETMIWFMFRKWIQSYRDLPLVINQWANVVRWEMRTRPFLRTTEFLWQEGHTADVSAELARERALRMIRVYAKFAKEFLALPTVLGVKSPSERFAGAEDTYTIEALMQNGWALQAGTSHFLGQNFAKAFDVQFKEESGEEEYVWATSWGVSTRMMGALIMAHSDDTGLVLPPRVAPIQIVLVLIFNNDEQKTAVTEFAETARARLEKENIRIELDARENMRPGAKYFEWERKGVPLRMEIGPRDVSKNAVFCAKRTGGKKFGMKIDEEFGPSARQELDKIQDEMLASAESRLEENTVQLETYEQLKERLAKRRFAFYQVPWACNDENERRIKEECKATIRCYPIGKQELAQGKKCFFSGKDANRIALFARAY